MTYAVEASELAGHSVSVRVTGIFSEPRLIVDGAPVALDNGMYVMPEGTPEPVTLRLKVPPLDFVPQVFVNERRVDVAPPLGVGPYLWCALPTVFLVVAGRGILPALIGLALSYYSLYLMRTQPTRRYLLTGLVNLGVIAVIAAFAVVAFAHHHRSLH